MAAVCQQERIMTPFEFMSQPLPTDSQQ